MKNKALHSGLSLLLALILALSLAACGKKAESQSESDLTSSSSESGPRFFNPLKLPEGFKGVFDIPDFSKDITDAIAKNDDTIGWLNIPNTAIDEAIVHKTGAENWKYYYRRNFDKVNFPESDWQSSKTVLWADFRCTFDGTSNGLSNNTVIYGHNVNVNDDPNDSYVMFAPLINFKNEEFAKKTPYVYFSTEKENLAWEIFAVSYVSEKLPYNKPYEKNSDLKSTVDEVIKHSLYLYNTEVSENDKILTLSTCTYHLQDGTNLGYPNPVRFIIMAKLVKDPSTLLEEADFTVNPAPKAAV